MVSGVVALFEEVSVEKILAVIFLISGKLGAKWSV
jgi:hypothetical protein